MSAEQDQWELLLRADDGLTPVLGNIAGSIGAVAAAAVSLQAIDTFLTDSLKAAIESETSMIRLAGAIERAGGEVDRVQPLFNQFADDIQRKFGISNNAVSDAMARFLEFGATTSDAMQLFDDAMDLSVGKTVDLSTAVDALARAYAGNTTALQKMLGANEEILGQGEKFATLQERLDRMYGGEAQKQVETMASKVRTFGAAWDAILESSGKQLAKVEIGGESGSGILSAITEGMFNIADAIKPAETAAEKIADLNRKVERLRELQNSPLAGPTTDWLLQFRIDTMNAEIDTLLSQLGRVDEQAEDTTNLVAQLLKGIGDTGPMTKAEDAAQMYEEGLARLSRQIEETWQQTMKLKRGLDAFDGMADTTALGFSTEEDQRRKEQERLNEALNFGGAGPQSWAVEHEMAVAQMEEQQARLESFIGSSMMRVSDLIILALSGARVEAVDIFKGLAVDFTRFFVNAVLEDAAKKLAKGLAGQIGGGLLGMLGLGVGGLFLTAGLGILSRGGSGSRGGATGGASSRGRSIGAGPASASGIYIETLVTNEHYIEDIVAPTLERLNRVGAVSFAG